jgi:hypothetical protein
MLTTEVGVAAYGETTAFCLAACNSDLDCNTPGYVCFGGNAVNATNDGFLSGVSLGCFIDPSPTATVTGQPCTSDAPCLFPPTNGYCNLALLPDGGLTGFTNGYCSSTCLGPAVQAANPDSYCGPGATCLVDGFDTSNNPNSADCYTLCSAPGAGQSSCRSGYICLGYSLADGGNAPQGVCWIPCQDTGCSSGTCQTSGYCQ